MPEATAIDQAVKAMSDREGKYLTFRLADEEILERSLSISSLEIQS